MLRGFWICREGEKSCLTGERTGRVKKKRKKDYRVRILGLCLCYTLFRRKKRRIRGGNVETGQTKGIRQTESAAEQIVPSSLNKASDSKNFYKKTYRVRTLGLCFCYTCRRRKRRSEKRSERAARAETRQLRQVPGMEPGAPSAGQSSPDSGGKGREDGGAPACTAATNTGR